jgi:hypothetical protein
MLRQTMQGRQDVCREGAQKRRMCKRRPAANERTFDDVFDDLFVGGQSRHELEQLRDNASQ